MEYNEYVEKFRTTQLEGRFSAEEQPWSKEDFIFFTTPLTATPEIKDDPPLRLTYMQMYLRLKKLIEKGNALDKDEQLKELNKIYTETAEKINLL